MTTINQANAVYYRVGQLGGGSASAVYAGAVKVWPGLTTYVERIQQRNTGGTSATAGAFTHGAGFTAMMDGKITHLAIFHYALSDHTPGQIHPLSLWSSTGVKLAHIDFSCPGSLLVADERPVEEFDGEPRGPYTKWYEIPLATPYSIVAGTTYRVSGTMPAYTYFSVAPPASLAPHMTAITTGFYSPGFDVFPTTAQPSNHYPIDVVAEFSY